MALSIGVAMVANRKALFMTLVDHVPRFEAHYRQFFAEFNWFVVLTSCIDAYISRYGNFCANNNNDNTTDYFTPCACAWGKKDWEKVRIRIGAHTWQSLADTERNY